MDILPQHLTILKQLCDTPTAPYYEGHVIAWLLDWAGQQAGRISVRRDGVGNVYLTYCHEVTTPPVLIEAHMDHPGFWVEAVLPDGTVRARFRGGVKPTCFDGAYAKLWLNDLPADGTIRPIPARGHWVRARILSASDPTDSPVHGEKTVLMQPDEPVAVNTIGMWDLPDATIVDHLFMARVCDDVAGVAAGVCLLETLLRNQTPAHVTVMASRAEEVGFAGVLAALKNNWIGPVRCVIGLETSKAHAQARQGDGPIVRAGDRSLNFAPGLTRFIQLIATDLAKTDPGFQWQRKLMDAGSCNTSAFMAWGYDAAGITIPLGNYHNMHVDGHIGYGSTPTAGPEVGSESVDIRDFAGEVYLLPQVVQAMGRYDGSLTPWRESLDKMYETEQRELLAKTSAGTANFDKVQP